MKNKKILASIVAVSFLSGCTSNMYTTWCEPKTETLNLAADTLFRFDKYSERDLLTKGKVTLDKLADQLSSGYAKVNTIAVVGHADRLGTEKYNYQLGLNRAKKIKQYLSTRGVSTPISVASAGESKPVTDGCRGTKPKSALTACLQPDRRVVLHITGIKRVK